MNRRFRPSRASLTSSAGLVALGALLAIGKAAGAWEWSPKAPPAPGVHPRVFFDAADLPALRDRIAGPGVGGAIRDRINWARRDLPALKAFAALDLTRPTSADLEKYFKGDEQRNIRWGILAVDAVTRGDAAQKQLIGQVITNYARLILASKAAGAATLKDGRTGVGLRKQANVWETDEFNVGLSWLFGGAGLPLAYDLLYGDLSPAQRDTIRKAIATATAGRRPWGSGFARGRAVSNWYGYHGELAVMLAAIEGEEGFDAGTWDRITQVLTDYWDAGFTDDGACREDSYGPNLGLRAGSMGYMVLARRGHDIFSTKKYENFLRHLVYETQPFAGGTLVGGASGVGLAYPSSIYVGRFTRPEMPEAAYLYRYFVGDDYKGLPAPQCNLEFVLFATDHPAPAAPAGKSLADIKLPLAVFSPQRGKLLARSDWTPTAAALHFDARPDAFLIGHDTVERGNVSFFALGRAWTHLPSFRQTTVSTDFSLVHIDGKSQAWKAPSVKFLSQTDAPLGAMGAADLKYAYDWQWSPPWPTKDKKFDAPWEPETSDPRTLGFPDTPDHPAPAWLPHKIYDEPGIGHEGSWMWRRPYNKVQRAFRTAALVRGERPYALVVDDIQKDSAVRTYASYLQLAPDLEMQSQSGTDIVLKDPKSDARLLVRVLQAEGFTGAKLEQYKMSSGNKTQPDVPALRLILTAQTASPDFKLLLFPYREKDGPPVTIAAPDKSQVTVTAGKTQDTLRFTAHADGRTRVSVVRGGDALALP